MNDKRSFLKPSWPEMLVLGSFAAVCSIQILAPPYIGLANNGDFGKVFARFACAPPDGGARNFLYFVPDYEFGPQYYWKSDVKTSEIILAAVPISLVKACGARVFNIRWLGALHLLLFLCAGYSLLLYLRGFGAVFQLAIGGLALWIFTDVAYVSYLNSFFSDVAAMLGLVLMVPLGLHLASRHPANGLTLGLFTAASLLFITSKPQHALWGIFPAAFVSGLPHPSPRRLFCSLLLVGAEAGMLLATPATYSAGPLFSTIFYKVAPQSAEPQAAVRELGLGEAEYRYIGTHAYSPGNPTVDISWVRYFMRRTSYAKLLGYWLRHPGEALRALDRDLDTFAPVMRQLNLSNFRRQDGHPPGARTARFASWSAFRSALYRRWPGHSVVWYALVIAGAVFALRPVQRTRRRAAAIICLGICAMAILEFCFASLADANETERHLFIFHVLTEITICFAAAWVLDAIMQMWRRRYTVESGSLPYRT